MTYPDPVYTGRKGEVSAWLRRGDSEPDLIRTSGTKVHYLATGADTEGLFGLYRWAMGPGGGRADPHFHRTISESFYILSGTVRIFDGTGWIDARADDFVHVPPGGLHGFSNESGAPASMLIHFARGAPREAYFAGLNHLGEMTEEERRVFFLAHDNNFVD